MNPKIKVAFASGTDDLNVQLIAHMRAIFPELPLYVVSEFPPEGNDLHWVRYRGGLRENLARCRHTFRGKSIRLAGVMLVPNVPFRKMRLLAFLLSPLYFLAVNENLNNFMLRPGSLPTIVRHLAWRFGNLLRSRSLPKTREIPAQPARPRNAAFHAGRLPSGKPRLLIVSAYVPFPLAHGGAVRIHNLTERAAADWDQILVCFSENENPPAAELLQRFVEVVFVPREGSHLQQGSRTPEVVQQFESRLFRKALRDTVAKWQPAIAQLEFTQMAQYAADCAPARTILVEHDITFDLYEQLARDDSDWDLHRELRLWHEFETKAWRNVNCVVTMSAKDQALVKGARAVVLPNGVDLDRFRVATGAPEPRRLLFVGSFSHKPNMIALDFFLRETWPLLPNATLHVIAGANHEYFLEYQARDLHLNLNQPGIEVDGFVSDVRPAYERAAIVIAPLVASAGSNLKVLEAMACGRPVVSTPAGVNGLDVIEGEEFVLARTGEEMAAAIRRLFDSAEECARLAAAGRKRVEDAYGWDSIAARQNELYRELLRA